MEDFFKRIDYLMETDAMDYTGYYNGYGLLHRKDLDGCMPEMVLCSGNRTGGKTFFWKRLITRYCATYRRKFLAICRKRPQVAGAALSFIEDVSNDTGVEGCALSVGKSDISGVMCVTAEIGEEEIIIGYFTYYNFYDSIKEMSNLFNAVDIIFKDEFQSLTGYVEDEVGKLRSIHKSVARGFGAKSRFVLTILCSNQISIVNPYYIALGIHKRLNRGTKFLRGHGWVLEVFFNPDAAKRGIESRFETAFGDDGQSRSDNYNEFLDSLDFVEKMNTKGMRLDFVFIHKGRNYGVWSGGKGFYVSRKYDPNLRHKYCTRLEDHSNGVVMMGRMNPIMAELKKYFDRGFFRFEDVECRVAIVEFFGITAI